MPAGRYADLVLCPGEPDWFAVAIEPGQTVEIVARTPDGAPISLTALAPGDGELATATGEGGEARVTFALPLGGARIGVAAPDAAEPVPYALELRIMPPTPGCAPDVLEPDEPISLTGADSFDALTLCAGDRDRFLLRVDAPARLELRVAHRTGAALDCALRWSAEGRAFDVDIASVADGGEALLQARAPGGRVTFELVLSSATGLDAEYALHVERVAVPEARPVDITGRVDYLDRPGSDDGLGPPAALPAVGFRVDAVDDASGTVHAVAVTGEDGAFLLQPALAPDETVAVRVVASVHGPRAPVRVGPEALPWALVMADGVARGAQVEYTPTEDAPEVAALHIARVAADGLAALDRLLPALADPPDVWFRWRPERAEPCGTCFFPGPPPRIELSGRVVDPDEWDDAVILHELGHYVAAVYSHDDSAGGAHDGSPSDPVLAWSEGFATFHAALQLGTPVLLDATRSAVRRLDVEHIADERAYGTADGTLAGRVSEWLVAALLWDLSDDDGGAEPADGIALAPPVVLAPLFDALAAPERDRGAPGVDLVDYLDALGCEVGAIGPAVDALAAERIYPYRSAGADCARGKARAPLRARRDGLEEVVQPALEGWVTVIHGRARISRHLSAGEELRWRPPADAPPDFEVVFEPTSLAGAPRFVETGRWSAPSPPAVPRLVVRGGAVEVLPGGIPAHEVLLDGAQ